MVTVAFDATIHQALTLMTQHRVGSIIVVDGDKIKGIWTERDLMFRALEDGFDARTASLKDRISENLISANADEVVDQLFDKFLGKRIRHLLIEDGGEFIGLISVGDVMKANLQQKAEELASLNHKVSLEYYENWKQVQAER
jgi:CBS domain-containing protein